MQKVIDLIYSLVGCAVIHFVAALIIINGWMPLWVMVVILAIYWIGAIVETFRQMAAWDRTSQE